MVMHVLGPPKGRDTPSGSVTLSVVARPPWRSTLHDVRIVCLGHHVCNTGLSPSRQLSPPDPHADHDPPPAHALPQAELVFPPERDLLGAHGHGDPLVVVGRAAARLDDGRRRRCRCGSGLGLLLPAPACPAQRSSLACCTAAWMTWRCILGSTLGCRAAASRRAMGSSRHHHSWAAWPWRCCRARPSGPTRRTGRSASPLLPRRLLCGFGALAVTSFFWRRRLHPHEVHDLALPPPLGRAAQLPDIRDGGSRKPARARLSK